MKAFVVNQKPSEQKLSNEDRNLKAKELLNKRKAEFNDDLDEVKSPRKVKSNKRKKKALKQDVADKNIKTNEEDVIHNEHSDSQDHESSSFNFT